MTYKEHDEIYEQAITIVEDNMAKNPTIPLEAFTTLVNEEVSELAEEQHYHGCDTYEEAYGYNPQTGEY